MRAYAVSCLMAGDTYRGVQADLAGRYKQTVSKDTLGRWFHGDPGFAAWADHQVHAMLEENFRIRSKATDILEGRIEAETDVYKINAVKGTAEDKIIALMRITQDDKRTNTLADALKHALKQPHQALIAGAATITDDDE